VDPSVPNHIAVHDPQQLIASHGTTRLALARLLNYVRGHTSDDTPPALVGEDPLEVIEGRLHELVLGMQAAEAAAADPAAATARNPATGRYEWRVAWRSGGEVFARAFPEPAVAVAAYNAKHDQPGIGGVQLQRRMVWDQPWLVVQGLVPVEEAKPRG
jgi:hypothetical protein